MSFSAPAPRVGEEEDAELIALARHLEAIASPVRLAILRALRTPSPIGSIRVPSDASGTRVIARQSVAWHIDVLMAADLVTRTSGPDGAPRYVVNHQRVFALVDEMRALSRLTPIAGSASSGDTLVAEGGASPGPRRGPRIVLVYGRDDGTAWPLPEAKGGRVLLGREAGCEIILDYDPFVSAQHAAIERGGEGYVAVDLGSRNGTLVNGERVLPSRPRALLSGDVLTIGRSRLVLQA